MSGTSSVGTSGVYEAGDQRNPKQEDVETRDRYKEGQPNSHKANDSKDERSIANKLARESERDESEQQDRDTERLKKDPTSVATAHGNEPSKGAKIDKELQDEEEAILAKKGSFGPK